MKGRYTVEDLLRLLGTSVLGVAGDSCAAIDEPAALGRATGSAQITFHTAPFAEAFEEMLKSKAGTILCLPPEDGCPEDSGGKTLVFVGNPRLAFIRVLKEWFESPKPVGVHPTSLVDPGAVIHEMAFVGPHAQIGPNTFVGKGSLIQGHVTIYGNTKIGENVVVDAGTVIGADGFGFEKDPDGHWVKFPHMGGVIIEDDVEIGANCCIDRGTFGDTIIRRGTKIDNMVIVAHNCDIGERCLITGLVAIAGSVTIGEGTWIAPGTCIKEKTRIGKKAFIGLGTIVSESVDDRETMLAIPAWRARPYRRLMKMFRKFAE